jgi:hypothetical protein
MYLLVFYALYKVPAPFYIKQFVLQMWEEQILQAQVRIHSICINFEYNLACSVEYQFLTAQFTLRTYLSHLSHGI